MSRRRFVATVVGLLLIVGACADSADEQASAPDAAESNSGATRLLQSSLAQPAERRDVVYTGDLVVRVASVARATESATRIGTDQGGFVFSQTTDREQTRLTVKVPSDRFDATVEAMAQLGTELRRTLKAEDVTAEVVDGEGRLKTAQASADRLRGLFAEARTPAEVVTVEAELAKREAEIESLQGRLRVLNDQVALATLDVRLTERNDVQVADDLPGFLGGLRTGIVALVNVVQVLLVVVGFLLPFTPLALLGVFAWRRYRRRHPRTPRQPPAALYWPPQAPPPGPPASPEPPGVAGP